jgi:leucyl-tRNA synthetase
LGENLKQYQFTANNKDLWLKKTAHQYLHKITQAYETYAFNKVLAFCRELTRAIEDNYQQCSDVFVKDAFMMLIQAINPIVPHLAHELWNLFQKEVYLDALPWPKIDSSLLEEDEITMAVQVNGKLKGNIQVMVDANDEIIKSAAFDLPNVKNAIEGKQIKKTIIVPKRIVNVVVA